MVPEALGCHALPSVPDIPSVMVPEALGCHAVPSVPDIPTN